jgi:hypothetical protein
MKNSSNGIASAQSNSDAALSKGAGHAENAEIHGRYEVVCRDKDGRVKWMDVIENVVATLGKNLLLDSGLAGSAYTVTGPFMGLISSVSFTATSATDTMASHSGWTEGGITNAPTYSGGRKTAVWSAASAGAKALSAALTFTFTGAGTVKGCFIAFGAGAVATVDSTAGTLYSAGVFTGGDKVVASGDSLAVSYSASL